MEPSGTVGFASVLQTASSRSYVGTGLSSPTREGFEGKRVPVVLQYSSFDFLKDQAKAIVEAHAKEASQRWNV